MSLLPESLKQPAGLGYTIFVAVVSAIMAFAAAERVNSTRIDTLENHISGMRATVQMLRDQSASMAELKFQIAQIQDDVSEIREALGLRLRPPAGSEGP